MMKLLSILFLGVVYFPLAYGQQISIVSTLQDSISETSGLIYLNGKLITHNDSGSEPYLYEIDSLSGEVSRSVFIENATNVDWEDLCSDDTYIYIADFGNNSGTRTDLKVYRLLISDYLNTPNDTVSVDTINFSYLDQTSFTSSTFSTNFDAEAILSYNDNLFVFTKNWGDKWTNIYALPKTPGTYSIEKVDSLNVQGFITGATYNESLNTILLSGYTFTYPFIFELRDFTSTDFSNGTIDRYQVPIHSGSSIQIEGITYFQNNQYYITSEINSGGNASLYRLEATNQSTATINTIEPITASIYPNPTNGNIHISSVSNSEVEITILTLTGKTVYSQFSLKNEIDIDLSSFKEGVYFLVIHDGVNQIVNEKIVKIK